MDPCRGSKKEVIQMLNLAVEKNVKSYIELLPSKSSIYLNQDVYLSIILVKECGTAVRNLKDGKVRYRHVLE